MSDWEIDDSEDKGISNQKMENPSDWEIAQEESAPSTSQKESLGYSAMMALPRIGTDLYKNAFNLARQVPSYYQKAKTEIPGYFGTLYQHPVHMLGQAAAGSQELINNLAQKPLEVAKYAGSGRLNLLPDSISNAISKITPEDTNQSINQLFGQPKYPGEEMLRGIVRNIPSEYGIANVGNITKAINPLKRLSSENMKNQIINTHDLLENKAAQGFQDVSKEVKNRGINYIPLWDKNINLNEMRSYFPKTKSYDDLFDKVHTGDYDSLRSLQSDLYTKAKKNIGSDMDTERNKGFEMLEKRDEVNKAIQDHMQASGNIDLANKLNDSRNYYKTLKNIYYNKDLPSSIIKMVDSDIRKIPKNLPDVLSEKSKPMKKLLDFHPGLENKVKWNKRLPAIATGTSIAAALPLAKKLYNAMNSGNQNLNPTQYQGNQ